MPYLHAAITEQQLPPDTGFPVLAAVAAPM